MAAADYFLKGISRGSVVTGTVSSIHDFGVFVHLDGEPGPGPSGLIRIPEIAWQPVDHPGDVLAPGDQVRARVLDVDHQREQVSLSLKEPESRPPLQNTEADLRLEALRRKLLDANG